MPSPVTVFIFLGLVGLAVAWTPLFLKPIPMSLPMVAVAFGLLLFWLDPSKNSVVQYGHAAEMLTEVALILAVMGAGLKIDRPFALTTWTSTWRLLGFVMPLSIAAITVCAIWLLELPLGMAILLGGILAPTDPVLASAVQVGPPGSGEGGEVRFGLTSEAGLNDGLAFPFVSLGVLIIERGPNPSGWLGEWVLIDLAWKVGAAAALGAVCGWGLVRVNRWLPTRFRLARSHDGLASVAITFLVFGIAQMIGCYGFVAIFASAVAIRNSSKAVEYHVRLTEFAEAVERLATAMVLFLFGGAIAVGALKAVSWVEIVFALLVLLAIRPISALVGFLGSARPASDRLAFGYFGVRGLGSLFYALHASNQLEQVPSRLWTAVVLVVLISIVLYGTTTNSVMYRLGASGR